MNFYVIDQNYNFECIRKFYINVCNDDNAMQLAVMRCELSKIVFSHKKEFGKGITGDIFKKLSRRIEG